MQTIANPAPCATAKPAGIYFFFHLSGGSVRTQSGLGRHSADRARRQPVALTGRVVVYGGGNTAIDVARPAIRCP